MIHREEIVMFKVWPGCLVCLLSLLLLCGLACGDAGGETVETSSGTATGGEPLPPDAPTTGVGGGGPTTSSTTTMPGSTTDPGTGSSGPDMTTGGISPCGDGLVDPGEECDDGVGNADHLFCTENCTVNVCGDGKLLVNWEICDEGPANSDEWGSLCGKSCEPGKRCGDGKLQAEFETCDLGPDNGGIKGDEQGILCDPSCRAQRLRGFVTEAAYHGDLGGLFGADLKCRAAAKAAGLAEPERFHAYLSTGDVDAKDRFGGVASHWPYVLVTGKKFADSFTDLVTHGPLDVGISVTESGSTLLARHVATNTAPGGDSFSPELHCQGWTSADAALSGRVGLNAVLDDSPYAASWKAEQWWTGLEGRQCNKSAFRLYCLEI